jgi:hypothetical protein
VMTRAEFFEAVRVRGGGAEFAIVTPAPELFTGEASQSQIGAMKTSVETASAVLAPFIGQLGFQRAQHGELADPLTLDANYVRRTDAELHWKEI